MNAVRVSLAGDKTRGRGSETGHTLIHVFRIVCECVICSPPVNFLSTPTHTDIYSDSDESYDILITNLNYTYKTHCSCVICVSHKKKKKGRQERRAKRKERQRQRKEKRRQNKAEKLKLNAENKLNGVQADGSFPAV